jgi:hypothetical protein
MVRWGGRRYRLLTTGGDPDRVTARRRFLRALFVSALTVLIVGAGPVSARALAATGVAPKVVLIVGPAGGATPYYKRLADQTATAAAAYTPNVVKVYSPDATWPAVKTALQGASIVVYLGHGNGWPSIYRNALYPPTQNGFGLNPHAGAADAHQYFGEEQIGSQIKLAPNAVVVFSHLCYASGNTEPGLAEGTLDQAQQRVDNYAAGFFRAGAGAVIADAYLSPTYYVTSILPRTIEPRFDLAGRSEPERPLPALQQPAIEGRDRRDGSRRGGLGLPPLDRAEGEPGELPGPRWCDPPPG